MTTQRLPAAMMMFMSTDGAAARVPLLFLVADAGGGHRSAARAVGQALELAFTGRFAPVLCDPLGGPGAARALRWVTGRYGLVLDGYLFCSAPDEFSSA
jgi:hypothetical protein